MKLTPQRRPQAVPALPNVVTAGATLLMLMRYDDWKARVRSKQTSKGDSAER